MPQHDRRLGDYLARIEAQHGCDHRRADAEEPNGGPRIDKDEERALALGRLSEFRKAADALREALIDRDIAAVSRISRNAAATYRDEVEMHRMMAEERALGEAQSRKERVMRRWNDREWDRFCDRADRAWDRLGGFGTSPEAERLVPKSAEGGFTEHARRESVLAEARRFVDLERQTDRAPEIE